MTSSSSEAQGVQAEYYAKAGAHYDQDHVDPADEHGKALGWLASLVDQYGFQSLLDVGSGTGRALLFFKDRPGLDLKGVEPSAAMRAVGHSKGLGENQLLPGDALSLAFPDNSFDVVCCFGVLHHIRDHRRAVEEMRRVARKAVFISDANNFGQGGLASRTVKQILGMLGLWRLFDLIRTGFKGYHYSEGDGVFYSYCLHEDVPHLRRKFPDVYYMSTRPSGPNLYRSAHTLAVFATHESLNGSRPAI